MCFALLLVTVSSAPGIPDYGLDFHSSLLKAAPILPAFPEPILPAPVFKTAIPAPIYHAPAPLLAHAPAPIYAHAPIVKAAPVIAAPVVKAVAPATSYATVTQVHVTHPQPVIKVFELFNCLFNN